MNTMNTYGYAVFYKAEKPPLHVVAIYSETVGMMGTPWLPECTARN